LLHAQTNDELEIHVNSLISLVPFRVAKRAIGNVLSQSWCQILLLKSIGGLIKGYRKREIYVNWLIYEARVNGKGGGSGVNISISQGAILQETRKEIEVRIT
jgi:hypothetical protein